MRFNTFRLLQVVPVAALISVPVVVSCTKTETRSYENEGRACLVAAGRDASTADGSHELAPGQALTVHVVFNACASFCANVEAASCEATVSGSEIQVASSATTREEFRSQSDCADGCLVVETRCSLGSLVAGSYELVHGEIRRTVQVPGTDACD